MRKIAGRGDAARGRRVAVLAGGESNRQRSPLVRYFGRVARMGKAPSQEQCFNWGRPSTLFALSAIFEARRQPHPPSNH